MNIPWYKRVHTGSKLQALWQISIGISLTLTFVVIPTWIEFETNRKRRKISENGINSRNDILEMLHLERINLRKELKLELESLKANENQNDEK